MNISLNKRRARDVAELPDYGLGSANLQSIKCQKVNYISGKEKNYGISSALCRDIVQNNRVVK